MITPYRFRSFPGNPSVGEFLSILAGGPQWDVFRAQAESPVPIPCTLRNIIIRTVAPGIGASREFEVQINGSVAATLTLSGASTEVRYTGDIDLEAGERVCLEYSAATGSPASATTWQIAYEIETFAPHQRKSLYWSAGMVFGVGIFTRIHNAFDARSGWLSGTTGGTQMCIAPIDGDIVGYYTRAKNGATKFIGEISLYKNNVAQDGTGGTVDTRQQWTSARSANTTYDTFTEFAHPVTAGDRLVWRSDLVSGSLGDGHMCVVFEADAEGESICCMGNNTIAGATNAAQYQTPTNSDGGAWTPTDDSTVEVLGNITTFALDRMRVGVNTTPGAGNTRNVGAHLNNANTAITVAITDADTAGTTAIACRKDDLVHSITIVDGDRWSLVTSGVSTPAASVIDVSFRQYIAPEASLLQKSQLVIEVFVDEDEELDEVASCSGDGEVATAENPADGVSLATTSAPLYWMEVTLDDGSPATVYRWAQMAIPYGLPKEARVLRFGTLTRALSDIDGGFESATITTELQDFDRVIRSAWDSGTLRGARVDYYCADLATLRSGGTPDRRFRGYISKCDPAGDRTFRITVEDALTNRLNAIDGQDLQVPTQIIEDRLATLDPSHASFDRAAPLLFGSIADEFGAWETKFVGDAELEGHEEEGILSWFLVSMGVVIVNEAFLAGLGATADLRVQVAASAFAEGRPWVPGKPGWLEDDDWSERGGRRWTLVAGRSTDPAIQLAKDGTIPLVVNVCGLVADQSLSSSPNGTVNSPARALLLLLNNYLVQDAEGDFLPILMDDDVPLFDTDSFEAVHDALAAMADSSYDPAIAGAVGGDWSQQSWRDRVAEFCRSFGYDIGINNHGQVILSVLDTTVGTSAFSFTTDQILAGSVRFPTRLPVENEVRFVHTPNYLTPLGLFTPQPEARLPRDTISADWLSGLQTIRDEASIAALGGGTRGRRRSAIQEHTLSRSAPQSSAVAQRRCDLLSPPNGRLEVAIGLSIKHGCGVKLGQVGEAEHWDLPWTGSRKCRVVRLEEDMDDLVITPTIRDVDDLVP